MNKCSVCGRSMSNNNTHFGLGCLKNMCSLINMEKPKNLKGENLLFAFSTYYRNKKYFGGVIADIQYYFWKAVILWKKEEFPSGTEFINHSLKEKPEDRIITDGKIIEDIIKDPNFIEKINNIIKENDNKRGFNITEGLNYVSSDLFLALNNTTINVIGNKKNENWKLKITITDRYDFTDFKEIDEYCDDDIIKGLLGSTANNLAMVSVASGVMHEYNVTIKFDIDKWEAQ